MITVLLFIIVALTGLLIWVTNLYFEAKPKKSSSKAVDILHDNMFSADFNANDFFGYATAAMVSISEGDFQWIMVHIEEHGQAGLDACLAYIQNMEPLPKYTEDPAFTEAIGQLQKRKQEVIGDVDYEFYRYNADGPYRRIESYK